MKKDQIRNKTTKASRLISMEKGGISLLSESSSSSSSFYKDSLLKSHNNENISCFNTNLTSTMDNLVKRGISFKKDIPNLHKDDLKSLE